MSSNPFSAWTQADVERHNARAAGAPPPAPRAVAVADISEAELHEQFETHCKEQGYLYVHARMDVPSTIAVGHPDFTVFMPGARTCFIEFKAPGKKARPDQLAKVAHAKKLRFVAVVTDNMPEALAALAEARK